MIITSYGVGRRIERAVNSILDQSLDDVEMIIVDDGSEDEETLASLDGLAETIVIERITGRRGVGVARNRGLALTTRPFVLCLDGDDWVEPRYLQLARDIFNFRHEVGIISSWVHFEGSRQGEWRPQEFSLEDLLVGNRIPSASAFRRAASEAVGFYAEGLGGYEDWEHWIAISAEGWKTCIIPEVLLHYDWRPDSLGRTSNTQAQRLVERIVSKHRRLYRDRFGSILGAKHEQVIALELEAREAWKRGEIAGAELQRVWCLVGELAEKLEVQGQSVYELTRELERTRQRFHDLEIAVAPAVDSGPVADGSHPK